MYLTIIHEPSIYKSSSDMISEHKKYENMYMNVYIHTRIYIHILICILPSFMNPPFIGAYIHINVHTYI